MPYYQSFYNMNISEKGAATVLVLSTVFVVGTTSAWAQGPTGSSAPWHSVLIERLVQKFGLKAGDVQAVFDDVHTQRQIKMQEKSKAHLDQLVKDGKITTAQEQLITAKQKEIVGAMLATRDGMQDKTPAERKAAMAAQKAELESWAEQNGIDISLLRPLGHWGMMRGRPWGHMQK